MAFFGPKTLDNILVNFSKVQNDLQDFVNTSEATRQDLLRQAKEFEIKASEVEYEANRADKILANINNLINV